MAYFLTILFILLIIYIITRVSSNKRSTVKESVTNPEKTKSNKAIKTKKETEELKAYYKDIVTIYTTPAASTMIDFSYIDSNFVWGTEVSVDFQKGGLVIDQNGKVIGELSNKNSKIDRIVKTLETYPYHYSYIIGYPTKDDFMGRSTNKFMLGIFVGWTEKANFHVYRLENNQAYNLKSNPCNEYVEIELSNKTSILNEQGMLLIKSGHLENALEVYKILWEDKNQWYHTILQICRKLKKYELEKQLIEDYLEKEGVKDEYIERLNFLNKNKK